MPCRTVNKWSQSASIRNVLCGILRIRTITVLYILRSAIIREQSSKKSKRTFQLLNIQNIATSRALKSCINIFRDKRARGSNCCVDDDGEDTSPLLPVEICEQQQHPKFDMMPQQNCFSTKRDNQKVTAVAVPLCERIGGESRRLTYPWR